MNEAIRQLKDECTEEQLEDQDQFKAVVRGDPHAMELLRQMQVYQRTYNSEVKQMEIDAACRRQLETIRAGRSHTADDDRGSSDTHIESPATSFGVIPS